MGRGTHVVVIGDTFTAFLAVILVPKVKSLVVVSPSAAARSVAGRCGATHVAHPQELPAVLAKATKRRSADVVYDFTGLPAGFNLGLESVREGGRLILAGFHRGGPSAPGAGNPEWVDRAAIRAKRVDLVDGGFGGDRDALRAMGAAVGLLNGGRIDPRRFVVAGLPLEHSAEAFSRAVQGNGKVIVVRRG